LFEALIDLIQDQLLEDLDHIRDTEPSGKARIRKQAHAMLLFTERHPGLTRVLTGDALANEDARLQEHLDALITQLESALAASAQQAIDEGEISCESAPIHANFVMHWILGRWLRYTQTAWRALPTADFHEYRELLGL